MFKSKKLIGAVAVALAAVGGTSIAATSAHAATAVTSIAPPANATVTTAANTPGAEALAPTDILETIRPTALNNGLCWTATSYAQGAQVFETDCGSAHFFVYDLTSTRMYLSGHYTTSLADYGGTFAFRNEPTTGMNSDAVRIGNNNQSYYEMTVGVASSGIYVHSNGGNHNLSIDNIFNNGANFYWLANV